MLVRTRVRNPADTAQEARLVVRFKDASRLQFMRRTWVPPRSERQVILPVRGGKGVGSPRKAETETLLLAPDAERELGRSPGLLPVLEGRNPFAVIAGDKKAESVALDTLTAVRKQLGLDKSMSYLSAEQAPRRLAGWRGMHAVVMTADRPGFDGAQRQALRRWMQTGGTVVVFADLVDLDHIGELLGESWQLSPVDRVTLSRLRLRAAGGNGDGDAESSGKIRVEQPIEMVRVLAGEPFRSPVEVRGWPALLSRSVGRGRLVVLTVSGRAWTHADVSQAAVATLAETLMPGGLRLAGPSRQDEPTPEEAAGQFVEGQVGYQVVSRGVVGSVLAGFVLLLVVGAAWWWRGGRTERLAVLGPVAAALAMTVLLVIGQGARQAVPPTHAQLQRIRAVPGNSRAAVEATIGLFDGAGRDTDLHGHNDGLAWPNIERSAGALVRMQTHDLDEWTWRDLPLPGGGVRRAEWFGTLDLAQPVSMDLRYGPDGLAGTLRWPSDHPARDVLLATPHGNLAVEPVDGSQTDGSSASDRKQRVRIGPDQVLGRRVSLGEGVLSRSQQQRTDFMRVALSARRVDEPTLLAWSEPFDLGLETDPPMRPNQRAFWSVPVRIRRAEPGTEVLVPWPLMRMQPDREAGRAAGLSVMPIYRPERRAWIQEASRASAFVGRFEVPEPVRPLKLTEAVIHFEITAVGRPVRVLSVVDGQPRPIETLQSPDGMHRIEVPAAKLRAADGAVRIGFDVGKGAGGQVRRSQMWSVRRFALQVRGTVQATKASGAKNEPSSESES